MKRSMAAAGVLSGDEKLKKLKLEAEGEKAELSKDEEREYHGTGFLNLDENLLYEILKHVDVRSLAMAACVNKLWHRTAHDERLWELSCSRHWPQVGCTMQKLRSVVLALGGFRRLHSLYIWPLSKPQSSSASSSSSPWVSISPPPLTTALPIKPPLNNTAQLGKDEVNLSLSLLSIRYFEKMNSTAKDK